MRSPRKKAGFARCRKDRNRTSPRRKDLPGRIWSDSRRSMILPSPGCVFTGWVRFLSWLERVFGHVSAVEKDRCGWIADGWTGRLCHVAGFGGGSSRSRDDLDHAGGSLEPGRRNGSVERRRFSGNQIDPDGDRPVEQRIVDGTPVGRSLPVIALKSIPASGDRTQPAKRKFRGLVASLKK